MWQLNHSRDLIDSIPDCRKFLSILFLFRKSDDLVIESDILKNDVKRLYEELKGILKEKKHKQWWLKKRPRRITSPRKNI